MKISYKKLWMLLIEKDITKPTLRKELGLSTGTMSKLNKMREQIANEFIAALQKDEIPWHQDWHNIGGAPHNAVTGRAYHGLNYFWLSCVAMQKNFSDYVEIAYSSDDLLRIKKEGKRAVLLSLENAYMLGNDIKNVEMFYNLGIRLITLCHFGDNDVCDSANGSKDEWGGLSPFGEEVVKEMNRLGMIVDLSHCSRSTVYDCIKLSKAPVVASHSGVYNYKAIPRNLTDPEMLKIAAKGGYIGLPAGRYFLSHKPKKELSVANIIDHVDYVKNLIGKEYIGIGTDFDGGAGLPGFENMSKMKELTKEMLRRGYTDDEIEHFWGKNFIRVFKAVEEAAEK